MSAEMIRSNGNRQPSGPYTKNCDNCGGRGHISKECPSPKQCGSCGGVDHIAKECPLKHKRCDICGLRGHIKLKCHAFKGSKKGSGKGAGGKGSTDNNCWDFAKSGTCPCADKCFFWHGSTPPGAKGADAAPASAVGKTCHACGATGHMKSECPSRMKTCDLCGQVGHLKATCKRGKNMGIIGGAGLLGF